MATSSDGLRCPLDVRDFEHWFAKHVMMPSGSGPEHYQLAKEIAWKAYRRGKNDGKKINSPKKASGNSSTVQP